MTRSKFSVEILRQSKDKIHIKVKRGRDYSNIFLRKSKNGWIVYKGNVNGHTIIKGNANQILASKNKEKALKTAINLGRYWIILNKLDRGRKKRY